MEEEAHIQEFLGSLESLSRNTKHQSEKLLLLEEQIKEELGELLGREIYSAGSQLLGLLMFDSDIDVATAVEDENDLKHVLSILESQNFDFEAYTNNIYHGLQFGVCCSVMEGVKIDVQLRSKKNISQLEAQIANLPNWNEEEISQLRNKKILARAIGGSLYVNWKHDLYRAHLPALILSNTKRTPDEMCRSHNTLLNGQCPKRATHGSYCKLHKNEDDGR